MFGNMFGGGSISRRGGTLTDIARPPGLGDTGTDIAVVGVSPDWRPPPGSDMIYDPPPSSAVLSTKNSQIPESRPQPSWGGVQHPSALMNKALQRVGMNTQDTRVLEKMGKKMWADNLREMKQVPSIAVGLVSSAMPGNPTTNHLVNKALGAVGRGGGMGAL